MDNIMGSGCCLFLAETSEFESQYGHSDDCLLSDALWTCSNMFDTAYVVTDTVADTEVISLLESQI